METDIKDTDGKYEHWQFWKQSSLYKQQLHETEPPALGVPRVGPSSGNPEPGTSINRNSSKLWTPVIRNCPCLGRKKPQLQKPARNIPNGFGLSLSCWPECQKCPNADKWYIIHNKEVLHLSLCSWHDCAIEITEKLFELIPPYSKSIKWGPCPCSIPSCNQATKPAKSN